MTDKIVKALERIADSLEKLVDIHQGQVKKAEDAPKQAQKIVESMMRSMGGPK